MGSGASHSKKKSISRQDFIFSSKIGEGGFSSVLSCMHVPTKTWVAIKETIIADVVKHQNGLAMLNTEIKLLSSLGEFPYIINMIFAFHDTKSMYLVLDLHQGADLRYHIRKKSMFNECMTAYLLICMSAALRFIHSRGILHRDVKPENIIFSANGVPYLTDFGVSYKHDKEDTEIICHNTSGTRQYLAPEVFTELNRHGVEADFWSLGVVLFETIYLRRPYPNHCPLETIHFQDSLYQDGVFLSSTSVAYAEHCSDQDKSPPLVRKASSVQSSERKHNTQTTSSNFLNDEKQFIEHLGFVASVIKDTPHLNRKLQLLQDEAAIDLVHVLEAENYSPRRDSFQHRFSFYDTKRSFPHRLRPLCPLYTRGAGKKGRQVSPACVAVMEGLLDPRQWARLGGGRNIWALRTHEWFAEVGLEWEAVIEGRTPPPCRPNTKQIASVLSTKYKYHNADVPIRKKKWKATQSQLPALSTEEKNILNQFEYTCPKFQSSEP